MRRSHLLLVTFPLALAVAACGGASATAAPPSSAPSAAAASEAASTSAAPSMAPSAAPSSEAPSSEAPSTGPSAGTDNGPTAAPTALDPSQLVTQSEASSLAGVTVGACAKTDVDNRKTCTYSATGVQVVITVVQAPSQAALDAGKAAVLADLQKAAANGLKTTRITGIGDDAALLTGSRTVSGMTLKGVGVYAVKGLTFVAITVIGIGHSVPTPAKVEAQATTTLSRVP
jgi:hypothetical protein